MHGLWLMGAWLACSSPPPTGPSPEASQEAAAAVCKVMQSARKPCEVEPPRGDARAVARSGDRQLALTAVVEDEQSALGITHLVMRVEVAVDGQARPGLTTPAAAHGGEGREALLQRAFHEWAVVYGVPLVDALLADAGRPALKGVEHGEVGDLGTVVGHTVYRGWSLLQGTSEASLDHASVLKQLGPALEGLQPGWHGVGIRIDHEPGATRWRCDLDGAESPALCDAARRYAWPIGGSYSRVRQYYVLTPPTEPPPM